MANRIRSDISIAPPDAPDTYERDFYTWSLEQARLLREGRLDALDRENVAEEIESAGANNSTSWSARCACCCCIS
jgi:hypothetical protein